MAAEAEEALAVGIWDISMVQLAATLTSSAELTTPDGDMIQHKRRRLSGISRVEDGPWQVQIGWRTEAAGRDPERGKRRTTVGAALWLRRKEHATTVAGYEMCNVPHGHLCPLPRHSWGNNIFTFTI